MAADSELPQIEPVTSTARTVALPELTTETDAPALEGSDPDEGPVPLERRIEPRAA